MKQSSVFSGMVDGMGQTGFIIDYNDFDLVKRFTNNLKKYYKRKKVVFLKINPVTYLVNGFRNCFINKVWFWEQPSTQAPYLRSEIQKLRKHGRSFSANG